MPSDPCEGGALRTPTRRPLGPVRSACVGSEMLPGGLHAVHTLLRQGQAGRQACRQGGRAAVMSGAHPPMTTRVLTYRAVLCPLAQLLMNAPWVWVIPLMLFVALAVVCEVAIYVAAQNSVDISKAQALDVLESKLSGIDSELLSMQGPIAALSSVIEQNPNMQKINERFPQVSDHIVKVRSCMWCVSVDQYRTKPASRARSMCAQTAPVRAARRGVRTSMQRQLLRRAHSLGGWRCETQCHTGQIVGMEEAIVWMLAGKSMVHKARLWEAPKIYNLCTG
eukprot:359545-Chlamydomonas_euryale.AAC.2